MNECDQETEQRSGYGGRAVESLVYVRERILYLIDTFIDNR